MAGQASTATTATPVLNPVRSAPALSATSDVPVVEQANLEPANSTTEAKPAETAANEAKSETAAKETKTDPGTDEGSWDNLPAWAKGEITKTRNQKREAEAAKAAFEQREREANDRAKKALESLERLTAEKTQTTESDSRPVRPAKDKFTDPNEYDRAVVSYEDALADWAVRTATKSATDAAAKAETERKARETTELQQKTLREQHEAAVVEFNQRKDKFTEDHPDYETVAGNPELTVTAPMADAIMRDEDGPAIAYYLGRNPDEAKRISQLWPVLQIAEMGRIAQRLKTPAVVKEPKPEPIKPINGLGATAERKTANEESMAEYEARRGPQLYPGHYRQRGNGASTTH